MMSSGAVAMILLSSVKPSLHVSNNLSTQSYACMIMLVIPATYLASITYDNHTISKIDKNLSTSLTLYALASMYMFFTSQNIFMALFMLEMSSLMLFLMMAKYSKNSDKISSLMFMAMINLAGSILMMTYLGMSLFCYGSEMLEYNDSQLCIKNMSIAAMLIFMFMSKTPVMVLHFWLPKAHVSSFGALSMILAGAGLKLGTMGLAKTASVLYLFYEENKEFVMSLSCVTSWLVSLLMIRLFDLKIFIAVSSILHMSVIWPMVSMNSSMSILSVFLMNIGHGLVSIIMFYLFTLMYEHSTSRSYDMNKSMESVSKMLSLSILMVFMLNISFPPSCNFFSEISMIKSFMCASYIFSTSSVLILLMFMLFTMPLICKKIFSKNVSFSTVFKMKSSVLLSYCAILLFMCPLL